MSFIYRFGLGERDEAGPSDPSSHLAFPGAFSLSSEGRAQVPGEAILVVSRVRKLRLKEMKTAEVTQIQVSWAHSWYWRSCCEWVSVPIAGL
jgi:hypothetical protein